MARQVGASSTTPAHFQQATPSQAAQAATQKFKKMPFSIPNTPSTMLE
jgi:hypothetical protein